MKLNLLLFSLLAVPAISWAQTSVDLNNFLGSVKSAEGSFVQKVTDKNGKIIESNSKGDFTFSRPGKFIWNYSQPYEQSIICNGNKLWVWDKDLNQVTVRAAKSAIPQSPASILFGSADLKKDWIVKELGEKDGLKWVSLKSKASDPMVKDIKFGFLDGLPKKMSFVGSMGETSELEFQSFKANPSTSESVFEFKVPKGADVLEARN